MTAITSAAQAERLMLLFRALDEREDKMLHLKEAGPGEGVKVVEGERFIKFKSWFGGGDFTLDINAEYVADRIREDISRLKRQIRELGGTV